MPLHNSAIQAVQTTPVSSTPNVKTQHNATTTASNRWSGVIKHPTKVGCLRVQSRTLWAVLCRLHRGAHAVANFSSFGSVTAGVLKLRRKTAIACSPVDFGIFAQVQSQGGYVAQAQQNVHEAQHNDSSLGDNSPRVCYRMGHTARRHGK